VVESLVSVVYWFPFYYTFKFIFLLWLSLPAFRYVTSFTPMPLAETDGGFSGADIIFRSFMAPALGRYFHSSGSTASGLRAKADSLHTE
jgi:receptor expression-enhancing protein 5/6